MNNSSHEESNATICVGILFLYSHLRQLYGLVSQQSLQQQLLLPRARLLATPTLVFWEAQGRLIQHPPPPNEMTSGACQLS